MESLNTNEPVEILIDFKSRGGIVETRLPRIEELIQKSANALRKAMSMIRYMAEYTVDTINSIEENNRPQKIEIEFGIDFDAEADAIIAKTGVQSSIKVKLTWEGS
ncbi:hypothetical protein Lepto7375DRAFT_6169 [Leptolyngbya sp. PCC 7375]|nr:hypothetical protein Lepto7375DRAFT_6169 [Leptolyngbya sp. PCC 7375]